MMGMYTLKIRTNLFLWQETAQHQMLKSSSCSPQVLVLQREMFSSYSTWQKTQSWFRN